MVRWGFLGCEEQGMGQLIRLQSNGRKGGGRQTLDTFAESFVMTPIIVNTTHAHTRPRRWDATWALLCELQEDMARHIKHLKADLQQ